MSSRHRAAVTGLLLLGFCLRVHALASVPPGWRDDEVIETTVHAQRVLAGELPLFFREASGHEPLYHWASAAAIALWGRGLFQVRLVSAFFGLLALAAHYRLARRLFGPRAALIATLALAFSFWALMYSRVKIRHISSLVFVLLTFDFAMQGLGVRGQGTRVRGQGLGVTHTCTCAARTRKCRCYVLRFTPHAFRLALPLALSLYTYPAARTAPAILLAFAVYLALFHRPIFAHGWRALAGALALTGLLALPLALAIRAEPGAQARLAEVGAPLAALLAGDPQPALAGAAATLGMFGWAGDPEALYNLPGRPVFGPLGAALFAFGLIVCAWRWRDPRYAFLLLWLFLGLAPAFVSIPAASLGHAIVALPAVYLVLAVGLGVIGQGLGDRGQGLGVRGYGLRFTHYALRLSPALLLALLAARDLRDYFILWPADPQVRHLYRADIREAALYLRKAGVTDVALTGRLSLWDARALELDAPGVRARWFNPETGLLYPVDWTTPLVTFADPPPGTRQQDIISHAYKPAPAPGDFSLWLPTENRGPVFLSEITHRWALGISLWDWVALEDKVLPGQPFPLAIAWVVGPNYSPPPPAIGASPDPPPQPFTTFVHLLAADGSLVAGYDRFDANGFRLWPTDVVVQDYLLQIPADLAPGEYTLSVGLYDPATGVRFPTSDGADAFSFAAVQVGP